MKTVSRIPGVTTSADIEEVIAWAFREELPKQPARVVPPSQMKPGWSAANKWSEYLATIDEGDVRNIYGVTPDLKANDTPHADAITIFSAWESMADMAVEMLPDWWPFSDFASPAEWGDLGRHVIEDALARRCFVGQGGGLLVKNTPATLLRNYALLGTSPVWEAERPTYREVRGANGKAKWFVMAKVPILIDGKVCGHNDVERDGWNPTQKRAHRGAYRKMELVPSPFDAACDRLEYEVWHAGLRELTARLAGQLDSWIVTGPRRPARPWEDDGSPQTRILPSLIGAPREPA